jgi:hypothetical protein
VVLADFGVSHRLAAAVEGAGESAISAAGREGTALTGKDGSPWLPPHRCVAAHALRVRAFCSCAGGKALGPFEWQAPEVCQLVTLGDEPATMATTPSDVYMMGTNLRVATTVGADCSALRCRADAPFAQAVSCTS